jgi:vacuolar-type H+-ATPase subunit I/STV1
MSPRTIYLSRLIGLFTLVVTASMIIDKPRAIETMTALVHDRSALLTMGVLATAAGMAIVLAHQVWRGGTLPVVVTLLGWMILLRGVVLLLLSQPATVRLVAWFRFDELFYLYLGLAVALGVYLTILGFLASDAMRRA